MAESKEPKKISLSQNIGYYSTMGILLILLGLIISTQTQKNIEAEKSRVPDVRQLNELVMLLKETQGKKSDLERQLVKLRQQAQQMGKDSLPPTLSSPQFQKLYQIAGLTPVKGKGIIVKINDVSTMEKSSGGDSFERNNDLINNDGLVHSDDLLKIVNELKASGSTAVAINNQRLVTTSEIVTAGNSIMVNQSRLTPPYTIKAIGPVDTMISALKMRGGIVEYLEVFGIKANIETKPDLIIPAYTGSLS